MQGSVILDTSVVFRWFRQGQVLAEHALAQTARRSFSIIVHDYYPDLEIEDIRACVQCAIDVIVVEDINIAAVDVEPGRHRFRKLPRP